MKKEIENETKIIVLSQDNIKKSIRDIKKRIINKNLNSEINYLNNINFDLIAHDKKTTIIIKGDNNFISKTENKLKDMFQEDNELINIVSCYNVNSNDNINKIIEDYGKLLNTSGIINIKEKNDLQNV